MIRSYRDLVVWQKAMDFTIAVYGVVRKLPRDEKYGLGDQLRRAVVSIPSNIAEGHGRDSSSEYARFLNIARGSLNEVMTQLEIASRLGYTTSGSGLYPQSLEIKRMLNAMIKKLRAKL